MDEMDTLDILIKLEFPAFPSDWRLGNYLLSDEQQPTTEVIFRFSYDKSVIRYGLGAISALFLPKLSYQFEESSRTKTDYDISSLWGRLVQHFNSQPLQVEESIVKDVKEPTWVDLSIEAIRNGSLKLSRSGVGGTYFTSLQEGKYLSVFKPIDEEPGGPQNPKKEKLIQSNFTPMLPWGTGANREVAAYHIGAFAGVPETHFIETEMLVGDGGQTVMKKGSLQKFVSNEGDCSDFGSNKFSVDTVHRLGILDICILNMDRNDENLLLQKGESDSDWRLVPIDHTYCFPSRIDSYFNWQYWPQTKKPFSKESLALISSLDVFANTQKLIELGIDDESVRNVMASTLLLKKSAEIGLTLFQIASMVSGNKNDLTKILDEVKRIESEYYGGQSESHYPLTNQSQRLFLFKNITEKVITQFLDNYCMKKDC